MRSSIKNHLITWSLQCDRIRIPRVFDKENSNLNGVELHSGAHLIKSELLIGVFDIDKSFLKEWLLILNKLGDFEPRFRKFDFTKLQFFVKSSECYQMN